MFAVTFLALNLLCKCCPVKRGKPSVWRINECIRRDVPARSNICVALWFHITMAAVCVTQLNMNTFQTEWDGKQQLLQTNGTWRGFFFLLLLLRCSLSDFGPRASFAQRRMKCCRLTTLSTHQLLWLLALYGQRLIFSLYWKSLKNVLKLR